LRPERRAWRPIGGRTPRPDAGSPEKPDRPDRSGWTIRPLRAPENPFLSGLPGPRPPKSLSRIRGPLRHPRSFERLPFFSSYKFSTAQLASMIKARSRPEELEKKAVIFTT